MSKEKTNLVVNDPIELNYEDVGDDRTNGPTLKDLLLSEIQRLANISKGFQEKNDTAKTKTKRDFYLKKQQKNNKKLADMIVRLDQVNQLNQLKKKSDEQLDKQ